MPLTPEQSWQSVLGQLQMEMPRASFDTWVRDTHVMSFENGVLIIGTRNQSACDWLDNRLRSTVSRLLVGIMAQSVEVVFIVDRSAEEKLSDTTEEKHAEPDELPEDAADVQVVNRLRYEEVVAPSKVVAIPGYFSRLIPEIGARSAWLYVGWRQAVWNGEREQAGGARSQRIPVRNIIRFSGLSRRTFFRAVEDETTWDGLAGLVERQDVTPQWTQGRDHRSHRIPNKYTVHMTLRLTRADAAAIQEWLGEKIKSGIPLLAALKQAAGVKDLVGELLPPVGIKTSKPAAHQAVMDIAQELHGEVLPEELQEAAEALHRKIIFGFGTILITHYFLEKVIPAAELTPPQAWLVTLMRDRCYVNSQTGEVRDEVCVRGSYEEMADWLGLSRAKTVWEWIREKDGAVGGFLAVRPNRERDEYDSLRLKVRLDEPIFAGALDTLRMAQVAPLPGADDTINAAQVTPLNGADGSNGWREWHRIKLLNTDSKNTPLSTKTTLTSAAAGWSSAWVLRKLLVQNHAHPKITKELLGRNASVTAFVSWLLYATSAAGVGIKDPFAYAITSLREDPSSGAGEVYDRLAAMPPAELIALIDNSPRDRLELARRTGSGNNEWDATMGLANPDLKTLRKILIGEPEQ